MTYNDSSFIYVMADRCASGLKKKLDIRSGSQRHRHFASLTHSSQLLKILFWLRITDEGSVPEMRIWSILLIESIGVLRHMQRYFNYIVYVTAHRCAGGMKKFDLRSGSQRHRQFVGFLNVSVQARIDTGPPFIRLFQETAPFSRLLRHAGDTERKRRR